MIFYNVAHNTPEWEKLRIGIATTSSFDKIVTPTGKISTQADEYLNMILAEMIMGTHLEKFQQSYWMEQGQIKEADARARYEFETGFTLDRGGFFTNDDGTAGASPDVRVFDGKRLVGGAEIKCPAPWTHVENLRRMYEHNAIDPKYKPQVQGQILLCDFEFVDWYSFHEEMPSANIRTYADEPYQAILKDALEQFEEKLVREIELLKSRGVIFPTIEKPQPMEADALTQILDGDNEEQFFIQP